MYLEPVEHAAHHDAVLADQSADIDALADEVIAEAIKALSTNDTLAKAIDEALANGSIDGAMLACILIPTTDSASRWKALVNLADSLIVAASLNLIYEEPGIPFSRYSDLDSGAIDANITTLQRDGVAEVLAARFGACAVLA